MLDRSKLHGIFQLTESLSVRRMKHQDNARNNNDAYDDNKVKRTKKQSFIFSRLVLLSYTFFLKGVAIWCDWNYADI